MLVATVLDPDVGAVIVVEHVVFDGRAEVVSHDGSAVALALSPATVVDLVVTDHHVIYAALAVVVDRDDLSLVHVWPSAA